MFGPIVIVYAPSATCAVKLIVSVLFAFEKAKPLIAGFRSPVGPVKVSTSLTWLNDPVFIGSLKLKTIDETLGAKRTGESGVACETSGAETDAGTSNASVMVVALLLAVVALVPSPRRANACQMSR